MSAVGTFAFAMMSYYFILQVRKLTSVYQQISVENILINEVSIVVSKDTYKLEKLTSLALGCNVRNHSDQIIFLKLRRASYSMQGRTPASDPVDQINIVQAKSVQSFALATFPDIELLGRIGETLDGHIDLEFIYGPSKENLCYVFRYEGEPHLGIQYFLDKKQGQVKILSTIKQIEHAKLAVSS